MNTENNPQYSFGSEEKISIPVQGTQVFYEATPNPSTMKFITDRELTSRPMTMSSIQEADRSPLGQKIMVFPWCESLFMNSNFISVTKKDWVDWFALAEPLSEIIREFLDSNVPAVLPQAENSLSQPSTTATGEGSEVEERIREILDLEIRPAVAQDGGDILFHSYSQGILYLELHGSCSGCPSSTMTLKEGIENRLKQIIPGLLEVRDARGY